MVMKTYHQDSNINLTHKRLIGYTHEINIKSTARLHIPGTVFIKKTHAFKRSVMIRITQGDPKQTAHSFYSIYSIAWTWGG
jgi:hypothetical protein